MDKRTTIEVIAAAVLVTAIVVFGVSYHNQTVMNATAQAKAEAQQQIIDTQKKIYADADALMKKNQQDYQDKLDDLMDEYKKVKSPQQAFDYSRAAVGPLPQPIQQAKDLPSAPSATPIPEGKRLVMVNQDDAIVPNASFLAISEKVNKCQQDSLTVSACATDKSLLVTQRDAALKERDAANAEAHDWKMAAKGGSWKKRAIKALKAIGCAGAGGAAGSLARNKVAGAAIGAAAGAGVCSVL